MLEYIVIGHTQWKWKSQVWNQKRIGDSENIENIENMKSDALAYEAEWWVTYENYTRWVKREIITNFICV